MLELLLNNLIIIGLAMVFLGGSWLANFILSLFYNIKLLKEPYDVERIKEGTLKILVLIVGTALLVAVITYVPVFARFIGIAIPDDFILFFNIITLVAVLFEAIYLYIGQAYEKFKNIIHNKK